MKRTIFSIIAGLIWVACGRPGVETPPAAWLEESPVLPLSDQQLAGRKVEDALFVVFREDLTAADWRAVFTDSQALSTARSAMFEINRQITRLEERGDNTKRLGELRAERDEKWVPLVGEAIVRVYERAAYLAVWDASLECRFEAREGLTYFSCRRDEGSRMNPLAGGMPLARAPVAVEVPQPHGRPLRPMFRMRLDLAALTQAERAQNYPDLGEFGLELSFRPSPGMEFLSGNVEPAPGARFLKEGQAVAAGSRGYLELRLTTD